MVVPNTEVQILLDNIQNFEKLSFLTPKSFENLSTEIFKKTKHHISVSTLKRLWGYVNRRNKVRISTLDILSQYIGFLNFNDFQKQLLNQNENSGFLEQNQISCSNLNKGDEVEIGWQPDRVCKLIYDGRNTFIVKSAHNTFLTTNHILKTPIFVLNKPLYLEIVSSENENQKTYIVGKETGLTILKIVDERG